MTQIHLCADCQKRLGPQCGEICSKCQDRRNWLNTRSQYTIEERMEMLEKDLYDHKIRHYNGPVRFGG